MYLTTDLFVYYFADDRSSGSKVYISASTKSPSENLDINFSIDGWVELPALEENKYQHTLTFKPSEVQYVAIVRTGFLSLIEVEVYQEHCE